MILEKNNLRTAQEWAKSYFELTAPHVHQKAGNHLRSHLRAIMALDHRILIRPEKKKSGRIFLRSTSLQSLANKSGCAGVNHPFISFIHHIWGETVPWGTVFIIQTSDNRMQYFIILQYKLRSFNIQDDRSTRGLLAKPLKNFQNHLYGQPVLTLIITITKFLNLIGYELPWFQP